MGINRLDEATRFFENLYGKKKVRLATASMMDRGRNTQRFSESPMRLRLGGMLAKGRLDHMIRKSSSEDIFYAPTPMSDDTGRKKEQAQPSHIVFGDADNGLSVMARARLLELGACLVQSGGITGDNKKKYHVYLRLKREIPYPELERLNRALKTLIDGDKWDCTTLLRIPGTINHKYPSKPMVIIERLASSFHDPDDLAKFLDVPDDDTHSAGVARPNTTDNLPKIPDGFNPLRGDFRMKKVLREWNGRFQANNAPHRYAAAVALVKEAIKHDLGIDVAYAYASVCEPLVDKSESEDGYDIQRDIYRTWHREMARTAPGAPASTQAKKTDPSTTPTQSKPVPATFTADGIPDDFPFFSPNLDELLAGDYKPLEPTMVACGSFALLYPGKSHSLVADRGMGKTHVAIAMVHEIMKVGGRVIYWDFEDTPDTFILDRMMGQHGIPVEMIRTQFKYFGGSGMGDMNAAEAIQWVADKYADWDLVIVDGVSASMGDLNPEWDGSKDVDYKKWHAMMIQPFLEEGHKTATLQLDHSTKSGPRASGTIQKGAKLTGVEYQLIPVPMEKFTIGRMGRAVLQVAKDRVGRIAKHARRTMPTDNVIQIGEDRWDDVAIFTLTSDDEGKITQAQFKPVNFEDGAEKPAAPVLSDRRKQIMDMVNKKPGVLTKSGISAPIAKGGLGGNKQSVNADVDWLVDNHYLTVENYKLFPTSSTTPTPRVPGEATVLDFSRAGKDKTMGRHKRECAACGDHKLYPQEFVAPDEIGYDPKRALCSVCADDPIARRTPAVDALTTSNNVHTDGPGWAQSIRERMEKGNMYSDPDDL